MTGSRPSGAIRPRRSHTLGGCRTCRRRHVKCDQKRPLCRTCRALGVVCEGFSDDVRWIRASDAGAERDNSGTRRHLYTEQSRLSMSAALSINLVSGSIDASLTEIDLRTRNPDRPSTGDIVVGPFAVLDFASAHQQEQAAPVIQEDIMSVPTSPPQIVATPLAAVTAQTAPTPGRPATAGDLPASSPVSSMVDSLTHMDDFLHWSDLLGLSPDQPGFSTFPTLDVAESLTVSADAALGGHLGATCGGMTNSPHVDVTEPSQVPGPVVIQQSASPAVDVLGDAPFLLKHFQDHVIPQMMAMPLGEKSPWKIMNVPGAVVTFSDLTFLGSKNISHARLANLYSLLACAAVHLALKPSLALVGSVEHWRQVADQTYQQAKDHMQMSLKLETQQPKKAKYKDQLMAICGLTEFAIISGRQQHARCFMVDAERLLRQRGLPKRRISQKARLLHHVYTWLRIVGESTYVLHDYKPSTAFLEALDTNFRPLRTTGTSITATTTASSGESGTGNEQHLRLDDFLRLEARPSDSDLNIDEPKDPQTGLHDIHLQDSRSYPETMYKQVYGIPETWLSLVSQTTRLANVMETFRMARSLGRNASLEAWETLQRRSVRLENMICSFNLGRTCGSSEPLEGSQPHRHMLRALNAALVIFFYRCIRHVHPAIVEGHVDHVISALQEFNATLSGGQQPAGPGIAWPAFIAGCEALTSSRREAILRWLDQAEESCGFAAFRTAREIMSDLWKRQDKHLATHRGDPIPTWIEIVQEGGIWPMFC